MTSSHRPRAVLIGPWASARASGGALISSGVVHLLLVIPTLVTLQIYDRVLSSRRVETLVMLLVAASASLLAWWLVETARVRWYAACAARLDQQLTGELAPWLLAAPGNLAGAAAAQLWKDIAVVRGFIGGPALLGVIDLPWTPVYLLIIGAFHPLLGVVALAGILLLVGLGWMTEWRLRAPAAASEQTQILAQHKTNEVVGFSEVMRAHGQEAQVATALKTVRANAADVRLTAELAGHGLKTWGKLTRQGLQLAMLAVGAWLVIQGQATGGVMVAGSILLGKALMPLEVLIGSWKQLLETRSALGRLRQAMALQARAKALLPSTALPPAKGELRVSQLGFRPPTQDFAVLHRVSFELPAGAMLAVLGPSGSGKSTLARIIAGVHAPTQGEVALDGASLHQYLAEARGKATGYMPQDVSLHSGTIAHNIARMWQPSEPLTPAQSEAVVDAAQRAGAHALITALPKGYDTQLGGEAGSQVLSGGQRQRIALARAIFVAPDIQATSLVVLDEPNSQLDIEGEAALERCLHGLRERRCTVIVVTHRPHLIALASHVLMLRDGTVEQFGLREQVRRWLSQQGQRTPKPEALQA